MSDPQVQEEFASRQAKREEQLKRILPALRGHMRSINEIGQAYQRLYPIETTSPEVVDAVTVAVPLRQFMLLAAVGTIVLAAQIEQDAANPGQPT